MQISVCVYILSSTKVLLTSVCFYDYDFFQRVLFFSYIRLLQESESSESGDEQSLPRDFEGGGGLTMALTWGNVLLASSWDGLIRVWVYTEDGNWIVMWHTEIETLCDTQKLKSHVTHTEIEQSCDTHGN